MNKNNITKFRYFKKQPDWKRRQSLAYRWSGSLEMCDLVDKSINEFMAILAEERIRKIENGESLSLEQSSLGGMVRLPPRRKTYKNWPDRGAKTTADVVPIRSRDTAADH